MSLVTIVAILFL